MNHNRNSIVRLMFIVMVAALNFALLGYINFSNKLLIIAILVLEYRLFYWASHRDEWRYWLGFEVFGWLYVIVDFLYFSEIRYGIIDLSQRPIIKPILAILLRVIPIGDPNFFSLLTVVVENAATLILAVVGGRLAMRLIAERRVTASPVSGGDDESVGSI
jgi:hypothetical protein